MSAVSHCILIEGAGTATAISVIKGIVDQKIKCKTVMVDADDFVAGKYMCDKFYKTPQSKSDEYIPYMINLCKKEGVDIYLPIIDYGFEKLSLNKNKFKDAGVYIMIADYPSIKICADKYLTYKYFFENKIPTPKTYEVKEVGKIVYDKELILKPRIGGRASLDVHRTKSSGEVKNIIKDNDNYVIQEFISGKEFTADCLSSLDGKMFIDALVRERIETKGGLATKAKIVSKELSDKIRVYLKKIAEGLKLPGVYNIQGFITKDGNIVFTEINPRFAGTHVINIKAGLNSIKHILDMMDGKSPIDVQKSIKINYDILMVRYWTEIFIDDKIKNKKVSTWENIVKNSGTK